jgi:hypothetical protein
MDEGTFSLALCLYQLVAKDTLEPKEAQKREMPCC